jgi:hypothetical protein
MPLQREKTALKRGALDNLYLHNNPRVEVAESNAGPDTLDDLLVSRPGGVVRTKTGARRRRWASRTRRALRLFLYRCTYGII